MAQATMKRYGEIDLLRSIAILLMIVYHTAYDLSHFYGWDIDVLHGGWKVLQVGTALLFLLLVGVSASLSYRHPLMRFVRIGSAALVISLLTYVINPETYIRFGILHLIAISALLIPLLGWTRRWAVIPGCILIALHPLVSSWHPEGSAFLILGIHAKSFATVDYYPLIPWLGIILIGYGIGSMLYPRSISTRFGIAEWPGRHSLMLYLIHQPILISLLWLILGRPSF